MPPATLTGHIVRPGDASYTDARLGWDQLFSPYVQGLTLPRGEGSTIVRMNYNPLRNVEVQLREQVSAYCESNNVPGFVAGVYHRGEQA